LEADGYEASTSLLMAFLLLIGGSGVGGAMVSHHPHMPAMNLEMLNAGIEMGKTTLELGYAYVPNSNMGIGFPLPIHPMYCTSRTIDFFDMEKLGFIDCTE